MTIKKLTVSDFPSSYLEAELESRKPYLARGILSAMPDIYITQELEYRKSCSITISNILKWLKIK